MNSFNMANNIGSSLGAAGLIIIIILAILGILMPLFVAGIYGSVKRIEKLLKEMPEMKAKYTNEQIKRATKPYVREEGSVYPTIPNSER